MVALDLHFRAVLEDLLVHLSKVLYPLNLDSGITMVLELAVVVVAVTLAAAAVLVEPLLEMDQQQTSDTVLEVVQVDQVLSMEHMSLVDLLLHLQILVM
jgi:hypothetical protein